MMRSRPRGVILTTRLKSNQSTPPLPHVGTFSLESSEFARGRVFRAQCCLPPRPAERIQNPGTRLSSGSSKSIIPPKLGPRIRPNTMISRRKTLSITLLIRFPRLESGPSDSVYSLRIVSKNENFQESRKTRQKVPLCVHLNMRMSRFDVFGDKFGISKFVSKKHQT